jgi:hypothetical protein
MNQWITIAVIGGASATMVLQLVEQWDSQRKQFEPCNSVGKWPTHLRRDLRKFVRALEKHATDPPVLFYRRYVDQWSMGDQFDVLAGARNRQSRRIEIACDNLELIGYALPDRGNLLRRIDQRRSQRQTNVGAIETGWFLDAIRDAYTAWSVRRGTAVIIVLRDVVGGLVDDDQIESSMLMPADWLEKLDLM